MYSHLCYSNGRLCELRLENAASVGATGGRPSQQNSAAVQDVHFKATKSILSGDGYRLLERMPGVEFNDLPCRTPEQKLIVQSIAKAVMITELINILSGAHFDCDRHGNQLRALIEGQTIHLGLYDFGEMALAKPNDQELLQLKHVIEDFPQAIMHQRALDSVLSHHIDLISQSGQIPHYLMRIRKALLALQDFQKHLSQADLVEIMQAVAKSHQIHPLLEGVLNTSATKIQVLSKINTASNDIKYAITNVSNVASSFFSRVTQQMKRVGESLSNASSLKKEKR